MESPSLEIFKPHLDAVLCPLLWVTHRGPCQPQPFRDSVIILVPSRVAVVFSSVSQKYCIHVQLHMAQMKFIDRWCRAMALLLVLQL